MEVSEKDLQRDGRNITLLQESLQASTSLCHEMLKHLENFENRVVAREATIMPLSRSLGVISRVNKSLIICIYVCLCGMDRCKGHVGCGANAVRGKRGGQARRVSHLGGVASLGPRPSVLFTSVGQRWRIWRAIWPQWSGSGVDWLHCKLPSCPFVE